MNRLHVHPFKFARLRPPISIPDRATYLTGTPAACAVVRQILADYIAIRGSHRGLAIWTRAMAWRRDGGLPSEQHG
jgi:hypothetical protein